MARLTVTGGAGYIGSHTCVELLAAGHEVVVFDDFSNSSRLALDAIRAITGKPLTCVEGDVRAPGDLRALFAAHPSDAVLHFAGLKAVGESVAEPLRYYETNVLGTLRLLEAMATAGTKTLVFSSSATVYGVPERVPVAENAPTAPGNPYGHTKLAVERMLADHWTAQPDWRISVLRYFNPAGAHPTGELGEDPVGVPNNLFPFVAQVAAGRRPAVRIFGDDYDTPDGTGVRDYIHVVDLARGHACALDHLAATPRFATHNLGRGEGSSVLDVLEAFRSASGRPIPHEIAERRAGDLARYYADPAKANRELGWRAERDLAEMCADTWRWQSRHPDGFGR